MADIPDGIVLKRDRELVGRIWEPWIRRTLLFLLAAFLVLAFLNVFGQKSTTTEVVAPVATLTIHSPTALRSGLIFESRFRILASQEIEQASLVLSREWLEGMTLNTLEPSPLGEASKDGRLSLDLGHIRAGQTYDLYIAFQVNPTTSGSRIQETRLFDGKTLLATSNRDLTIFP